MCLLSRVWPGSSSVEVFRRVAPTIPGVSGHQSLGFRKHSRPLETDHCRTRSPWVPPIFSDISFRHRRQNMGCENCAAWPIGAVTSSPRSFTLVLTAGDAKQSCASRVDVADQIQRQTGVWNGVTYCRSFDAAIYRYIYLLDRTLLCYRSTRCSRRTGETTATSFPSRGTRCLP